MLEATMIILDNSEYMRNGDFTPTRFTSQSDAITLLFNSKLALKHRQNKNQKQRIIVFIASPISESHDKLVLLGKKLKKNNIALDVILFGNVESEDKLNALVNTVSTGGEHASHLVCIPAGAHVLSDVIVSSPIIGGEGVVFEEDMDAELALALRISMEEERVRNNEAGEVVEDDDELARALAMSMETDLPKEEEEDALMDIIGDLPGVDKNDQRFK